MCLSKLGASGQRRKILLSGQAKAFGEAEFLRTGHALNSRARARVRTGKSSLTISAKPVGGLGLRFNGGF